MKTLQLSLLKLFAPWVLSAAFMSISQAAVTISWDPSPDAATPNAVAGYHVYYGSLNFASVPVGNQTNTVLNNLLPGKLYSFAVSAYDANGTQSDLSNAVYRKIPANGPGTITLEWDPSPDANTPD